MHLSESKGRGEGEIERKRRGGGVYLYTERVSDKERKGGSGGDIG